MPSHDRRAAGRRRAWGRGPIILKLESLERRELLTAWPTRRLPDLVNSVADHLDDRLGLERDPRGRRAGQEPGREHDDRAVRGRALCLARPGDRQVFRADRRGRDPGRPGARSIRPVPDLGRSSRRRRSPTSAARAGPSTSPPWSTRPRRSPRATTTTTKTSALPTTRRPS